MVFLVASIVDTWGSLSGVERGLFGAFLVLGAYMLRRAYQASRILPAPTDQGPSLRYVVHIGFNVIALFDAFTVILVLDLGGPIWLIVAVAVAVAAIGHSVRRQLEGRLVPGPAHARQPSTN
jgi:hypothetical protein